MEGVRLQLKVGYESVGGFKNEADLVKVINSTTNKNLFVVIFNNTPDGHENRLKFSITQRNFNSRKIDEYLNSALLALYTTISNVYMEQKQSTSLPVSTLFTFSFPFVDKHHFIVVTNACFDYSTIENISLFFKFVKFLIFSLRLLTELIKFWECLLYFIMILNFSEFPNFYRLDKNMAYLIKKNKQLLFYQRFALNCRNNY